MKKRLNHCIFVGIFISILWVLLGVVFTFLPNCSLLFLAYSLAFIFIGSGIYFLCIQGDFIIPSFHITFLLLAILHILLGCMLILYPNILRHLIPILLGCFYIMSSVVKMRIAFILQKIDETSWIPSFIMSILSLVCGILLILYPAISYNAISFVLGIMMMVYGCSDIVSLALLKHDFHAFCKYFNI